MTKRYSWIGPILVFGLVSCGDAAFVGLTTDSVSGAEQQQDSGAGAGGANPGHVDPSGSTVPAGGVPAIDDPDPGNDDSDTGGASGGEPAEDAGVGTEAPGADAGVSPDPTNPCYGKRCGDECNTCPEGAQCLVGPGSCDKDGACVQQEPVCGGSELSCPAKCPVPKICHSCADGSCAVPVVACNEDGSCGAIDWQCKNEEPECKADSECPVTKIACKACENGSLSCPEPKCHNGQCSVEWSECGAEYDPCAGKQNGDSCTLCSPTDLACVETGVLKTCKDGHCSAGGAQERR